MFDFYTVTQEGLETKYQVVLQIKSFDNKLYYDEA